jgi:hypothetical protein
MAKVVKKGVKPTAKKATAKKVVAKKLSALPKGRKKLTEKKKLLSISGVSGDMGIILTEKKAKSFQKAVENTPLEFRGNRSAKQLYRDYLAKGKKAKKSINGKWYTEYVGKDGKKHREYRTNRMDYKFGI